MNLHRHDPRGKPRSDDIDPAALHLAAAVVSSTDPYLSAFLGIVAAWADADACDLCGYRAVGCVTEPDADGCCWCATLGVHLPPLGIDCEPAGAGAVGR